MQDDWEPWTQQVAPGSQELIPKGYLHDRTTSPSGFEDLIGVGEVTKKLVAPAPWISVRGNPLIYYITGWNLAFQKLSVYMDSPEFQILVQSITDRIDFYSRQNCDASAFWSSETR